MSKVALPAGFGVFRRLFLPELYLAGLLILFALLSFNASRHESVAIDEFCHLSTGVYYWQSGDYSFDKATPPLWKMAMSLPAYLAGAKPIVFRQRSEAVDGWEPWSVATDFMRDNAEHYTGYLQSARMVNVMTACVCLIYLFRRARQRFGATAALYGTTFLALSPTLLAHSHYATTDTIATTTVMVTVFTLLDYQHSPSWQRLALATMFFTVSLLSKYTALILLPMLLGVPLLVAWQQAHAITPGAPRGKLLCFAALRYGRALLVILLPALLLINLMYGFRGTGVSLAEMKLQSRALGSLGQTAVANLPLPLPKAFVEGFDFQKADSDYSEFPSYFMGKWSVAGSRAYYLGAFCLKETVPFIFLLLAAILCRYRNKELSLSRLELLLLCFVPITLFIVLSFMNRLNVGVRYLLPAYPFLCYFISRLYAEKSERYCARVLFSGLLVLHCFSVGRIAPHYMSYFNELGGGPEKGYKYLLDSNLDLGQDLIHLRNYMTKHAIEKVQLAYFGNGLPEFYGINYEPLIDSPRPGYVAISISLLMGQPYLLTYLATPFVAEFDQYRFMRSFVPVGRAGYSILIYRID